jgi:hypothetical protein
LVVIVLVVELILGCLTEISRCHIHRGGSPALPTGGEQDQAFPSRATVAGRMPLIRPPAAEPADVLAPPAPAVTWP